MRGTATGISNRATDISATGAINRGAGAYQPIRAGLGHGHRNALARARHIANGYQLLACRAIIRIGRQVAGFLFPRAVEARNRVGICGADIICIQLSAGANAVVIGKVVRTLRCGRPTGDRCRTRGRLVIRTRPGLGWIAGFSRIGTRLSQGFRTNRFVSSCAITSIIRPVSRRTGIGRPGRRRPRRGRPGIIPGWS